MKSKIAVWLKCGSLIAFFFILFIFLSVGLSAEAANRSSSSSRRQSSAISRAISDLGSKAEKELAVPILLGVPLSSIGDTWGQARTEGRTHEGTDILASRDSLVVSPTDAVVTSAETDSKTNTLGGTFVYTTNPGGERYYYAHLDKIADGIKVGKVLKKGDLIGYVGNTGNAAGGPTHLHFGIYTKKGATNPFPRITKEFTPTERMRYLGKILDDADEPDELAQDLVAKYRGLFVQTVQGGVAIPKQIAKALSGGSAAGTSPASSGALGSGIPTVTTGPARDLVLNSSGDDVKWLQAYLINSYKGPSSIALSTAGPTGFFGALTQNALIEYQKSVGIIPASGTYSAPTRAYLQSIGVLSR